MIKIKNTALAILKFEEAAIKHAESTEQGDYKTGNKCYTVIVQATTYLKEHNEIQKLSEFLSHSSVGVRMWAATYLLPVEERKAIKVLEQIAGETGIHSLDAEMTLSEWRKGNLHL